MLIHKDSHLDHSLTTEHLVYLLKLFADREEFFLETIELPSDLPAVPNALYGPLVGDEPIEESLVEYKTRGDRKGKSRMISRPTRELTVIAGPHADHMCILYTSYGGPSGSAKEPWETEKDSDERRASEEFWSQHALALEG